MKSKFCRIGTAPRSLERQGFGFVNHNLSHIMRMHAKALGWVLIFFLFAGASQGAAPKESVEKLLQAIQSIQTGDAVSKEQKKKNRELSDRALGYLDVTEVSKKALGKHWAKRSDAEKKQFRDLLSELFVYVAFPNSGKFFKDLKLEYAESEVNKTRALVPMTVLHKEEGEVDIDFFLESKKDGWKVVDVHLDGISMRNNLRSQFYRVIAEKDFNELMKRMQKKLKEAKA